MIRTFLLSAAAAFVFASPAAAQDRMVVSYSISAKKTEVQGAYTVDGFSTKQMLGFISTDCAGKVGQMTLKGKPRKKKGQLVQKFTTTCDGGLNRKKHKGSVASINVVQPAGGKRFAQIFASDGKGNMVTYEEPR